MSAIDKILLYYFGNVRLAKRIYLVMFLYFGKVNVNLDVYWMSPGSVQL